MAILKKMSENTQPSWLAQSVSWGSLITWACMLVGLILMMVRFSYLY